MVARKIRREQETTAFKTLTYALPPPTTDVPTQSLFDLLRTCIRPLPHQVCHFIIGEFDFTLKLKVCESPKPLCEFIQMTSKK